MNYGKKLKLLKILSGLKNITIPDPKQKCFGGKVVITMNDGSIVSDELG